MGKYLRDQYEFRDISKALAKVHRVIDHDYEKLSDKCHILELSHNKYRKILKMTMKFIESCFDLRTDNYAEWRKNAQYLHRYIFCEFKDPDLYVELGERKQDER